MEKRKQDPPVTFRSVAVERQLAARTTDSTPGQVARRDLERYYHLLAEALASVHLTASEASLICDACNGTLWEPHTIRYLWAEVADAIRLDRLDEKWHVDGPALVAKLQNLDPWQSAAIVDAVERFWLAPHEPDRLKTVGLVREEV